MKSVIKEAVLQVHRSAYGGIADYILQTTSSLLAAADCSFAKQLLEGRGRDLVSGPGSTTSRMPAHCWLPPAAALIKSETTSDLGVAMRAFFWSNAQCVFVTIFRWREEQELCHEHELFLVTSASEVKNASDLLVHESVEHPRTLGGRNVPPIWLFWSAKVDTSPDTWRCWRW